MSIRAFLSYSHKDKRLARKVKDSLGEFGFNGFLAHDDIRVSAPWRQEILKNLRECDIFFPILTRAFCESEWTDQEAGYALGKGKTIVPLRADVEPYGFVGDYQAVRLKKAALRQTCWAITESLKDHNTVGGVVKDAIIEVFLESGSFEEAGDNVEKIMKFRPFSKAQLARIIGGSSRNQNIYGCFGARSKMGTLIEEAQGKVPGRLIRVYRAAVKSWG